MTPQAPADVPLPAALRAPAPRPVPARRGPWVVPLYVALYLVAVAGFGLWSWSGIAMRGVGRGPARAATVAGVEDYNGRYRRVRLEWAEGGRMQRGSVPLPAAQGDALEVGQSVRLWVARLPRTEPILAVDATLRRVHTEGDMRIGFGLVFLAACTLIVTRLVRVLARERWLMRRGTPIVGRVVGVARQRLTGAWSLQYSFDSSSGVKSARAVLGARRTTAAELRAGAPVFVLYDPANPARHMLWGTAGTART